MLRLARKHALVDLEGLRMVERVDEKRACWKRRRVIVLKYTGGEEVTLDYGIDDEYHHQVHLKKARDADFRQIEEALLNQGEGSETS